MGQALQKLRGGGGTGGAGVRALRAATAPPSPRPHAPAEPGRKLSPSPTSQTVRQSVEVRPHAPEPQPIIEPEPIKGDWDRNDPKYSAMMQQVVGKITTRPAGKQEMGSAQLNAEFRRPKPANRHTSAATGPDEQKVVVPGSLNIEGLREALRLYREQLEKKQIDVEALAKKVNVDWLLLQRLVKYTSLPEPPVQDTAKKVRA